MAKGIDIAIAADTRSAMSAINRGLIDPLEDVSEILEDVGKDGDKATDKLEKGMRDAQRRTDDAKDEIKDLRDELNKAGRAGKKTGDDIDDGFRKAGEGAEDFKQEAASTARESAASFDGSAESIVDSFQEVAANAFAGFGPAGALAGLAAAAGIGLVTAEFQRQQEDAQKLRDRLSGLYSEALESGRDYIDQSQFIAESNDLRFNTDRADEWKQLQKDSKDLALSENVLIKANSGDLAAQESVRKRINELVEENTQTVNVQGAALEETAPWITHIRDRWAETSRVTAEYAGAVKGAQESESAFWQETLEGASAASTEVDKFGNKLVTLPDGTQVLISAETGLATANIDAFAGDVDGLPDTHTTTAVLLTEMKNAQREIDGFITKNNGREIRVKGRMTIDNGGWDQ